MNMKLKKLINPAALLAACIGSANAEIVTVGPSLVDYDYITITAAIAGSNSGDEILIQPGTYPENLVIDEKDLTLRNAGGGEVVVFGQDLGRCLITNGGSTDVEVFGITFSNGFSSSPGAGVAILGDSTCNLTDCIIENSSNTGDGGGGLYMSGGGTIRDTIIRNNSTTVNGGGVMLRGHADKNFIDCTIEYNSANEGGGMAYLSPGDHADIERCKFVGNAAVNRGGAIALFGTSSPGIMRTDDCLFELNNADLAGGAIWVSDQDEFHAVNCVFRENSAESDGGVVRNEQVFYATHCTFYNNDVTDPDEADTFQGLRSDAQTGLVNCIVVNESSTSHAGPGLYLPNYSLYPEGPNGAPNQAGSFNADPMFVDPDGTDGDPTNDLMLMSGSPAIDSGNSRGMLAASTSVIFIETDYSGNIRNLDDPATSNTGVSVWGLCVDLGAHEYVPAPAGPACVVDFVEDGVLDVFDVFEFLNQFNAGCP